MPKTPENSPFYTGGLNFSCKCCSGCCRYEPGYVFLSGNDVLRMAKAVNIGYKEFILAFCRWVPVGNGTEQLSLREKSNFDCIFWGGGAGLKSEGGCSIYSERPLQCRAFPFWPSMLNSKESWKSAAKECPGIGQGDLHSFESVNTWLEMRKNEPIITRKDAESIE